MIASGAAAAGPAADRCQAIRRHLAQGAPWDACDAFRLALAEGPVDASLFYWGAVAHARAGATLAAGELLDRAEAHGAAAETALHEAVLSQRGRLAKDRLVAGADVQARRRQAHAAFEHYHAAYALRRSTYPGINAAAMAWMAGDTGAARVLAQEVADTLAAASAPRDLWHHASAGEAALLLGDAAAARREYRAAARVAGDDIGSTARMRAQLRLLAPALQLAAELLALVPAPAVLAFAGHMIDAPGRSVPRFPAAAETRVAQALGEHLAGLRRPIIHTSAACGADLLLIEAALAQGAEVTVVLPFAREDFVRTSVAIGGGSWVPRFEAALSRVHRVVMASHERHLGDDVLYEHAARLVEGLAALRATQLATEPTLLAVLSDTQTTAAAVGGTRATVQRWRARHGEPSIIELSRLAPYAAAAPPAEPPARAEPASSDVPSRAVRTLLFADVAGFGRLHDAKAPQFHAHFLAIVARCIAAAAAPPLQVNTWGDALYGVFASARAGAEFAWQLGQAMQAFDWPAAGLDSDLRIRIALHIGPVFRGWDPVMRQHNHFGRSVTEAARIEPVTQPGAIYASEAFAATLASDGLDGFAVEFLGQRLLAKDDGELRLYRLTVPRA